MKQVKESQIETEVLVCPYCMNDAKNKSKCCGESSAHFEMAYIIDDEAFLKSEVKVVKQN